MIKVLGAAVVEQAALLRPTAVRLAAGENIAG